MAKVLEFDRYARDYSGGNEDPLKRLFGENLDQFIYVKTKWLWNYLQNSPDKTKLNKKYQLLDYGCVTGEMLKWLKLFGFPGYLHGADVHGRCCKKLKRDGMLRPNRYFPVSVKQRRILPTILFPALLPPVFFII